MAREWTDEQKQMLIKGGAVIAVVAIVFLAISLLQNRGPERCASVLISGAKDTCWKQVAMETGDMSYCGNITSHSAHDQCITAFMAMKNITGGGASACNQMAEQVSRDNCFYNLAKSEQDEEHCARIETKSIKDACHFSLASSLSDPSLCGMIGDSAMRAECSNNLYFSQAMSEKNAMLCRNMVADDMDYYNYLTDTCILSVASNAGDKSLCGGISNSTLRNQCLAEPGDFASCDSISDENSRNICFYSFAVDGNDPNACETVPTQSLRDNCYYQFATSTRNASLCNRIMGANMKAVCFSGAGG